MASSRWNQGCMRCPAGKRRQGGRRGGRGGCRAASAAVVFWEAGPERPQGRGLPMLRSKLSSDRLPSEPPHPQGHRPTAGAPGAASPPGLDRRPRTAWCRGRGSAKPRRAHDRGQGHAGGPTQRQRPESAWGPFSPREARLETRPGKRGRRATLGCPAARGAERAPCRDRTPWGKRDREGGAARLPASPSGSEPGEGRRPASRWSVEGCGLHVRRPSLRREAPGPDGRAGRLGGAAGLRAGAVQAGAWEGRRPRAAEGRPPHPCTPLHGAPHPLPPSSLPCSCRRATVSGARVGGARPPHPPRPRPGRLPVSRPRSRRPRPGPRAAVGCSLGAPH